jgi:outer membrane protein OmpA-like peptidoglycan-associated protein
MMKKIILMTTMIAASAVNAAEDESKFNSLRSAGVFFSSAITGAVLAGPVGMIAAAGGGVWLDEQVKKAATLDETKAELVAAESEISALSYELALLDSLVDKSVANTPDQLQLELLFKTGQSELTDYGVSRLVLLEKYMLKNKALNIRLDGYADPRGNAEYNVELSNNRVIAVAEHLRSAGVDPSRIDTYSHGAAKSIALKGDVDGYAFERVVRIQLSSGGVENNGDEGGHIALVDSGQ